MKEAIIKNIDQPRQLEKLYRSDEAAFKKAFNLIYPDFQENLTAKIWYERLNFEQEAISWGSRNELIFVLVASMIAGLIAKIPAFFAIDQAFFYPRNIAFIVFPMLIAYFLWRQSMPTPKIIAIAAALLIADLYINFLPNNTNSDTLILACIHLPLFLWMLLGYAFIGGHLKNHLLRLDYLRYNGDLVVMTTIILLAGALLTAVTIGLFNLIDIKAEEFYFQFVGIWGLSAAPIVGTYLVRTNPQLVSKVSPVIAKVFTPLVLVMLVVYLCAVVGTGKDPYKDRDFLIVFNLLLIGVMAIILFSIAETSKNAGSDIGLWLLFAIAGLTVVVNGIALSAIVFRISEWGISPNRMAVLGGNILILANLLQVAYRLFRAIRDGSERENIEKSIAGFLPVYGIWTAIVVFVFPILFHFI